MSELTFVNANILCFLSLLCLQTEKIFLSRFNVNWVALECAYQALKNNNFVQKSIELNEIGKNYLLSELSSGTTGEILHVDAGYNVVGMKNVNAPDISKV